MYTCFFLSFGPLLPTFGFRVVGLLVGVLHWLISTLLDLMPHVYLSLQVCSSGGCVTIKSTS